MSIATKIIQMSRRYEEKYGYKPTSINLTQDEWKELKAGMGEYLMYETDVKDKHKLVFMGMSIIIEGIKNES